MDTAFTEEQEDIRRTVRELLAKQCGPEDVKSATRTPAGYDESLWHTLGGQLGLPGIALPARYGGAGYRSTELALACEEVGRTLLPSPLLPTAILCVPLLQALGTPQQRSDLLPQLATGELTAALVIPGDVLTRALGLTAGDAPEFGEHRSWAGGGRAGGMQAAQQDGEWRLFGEAAQVLGGHHAGLLVVAAHTGGFNRDRTLLFLVRTDQAPGLQRTRHTTLDETRPAARVELRDTPAELLGTDGPAAVRAALADTGTHAAAALSAEAAGAADAALHRTLEHAAIREQFGRPIGSFQALQHRLADVYVQVQVARSAACYAAWEGADAGPLALAQALEAQRHAAGEAVQLHGGTGFTWEHDAHLYFKRAASDDLLFGPPHRLRAHVASAAGLFTPEPAARPDHDQRTETRWTA